MSAKTWQEEFCPKPVKAKTWTDKQCFEHTIKKYQGAMAKALKKHGLQKAGNFLIPIDLGDPDPYDISTSERCNFNEKSCALCTKYLNRRYKNKCSKCPLSLAGKECGNDDSPYDYFCDNDNPQPMIRTMKKMITQCDKKGNWDL